MTQPTTWTAWLESFFTPVEKAAKEEMKSAVKKGVQVTAKGITAAGITITQNQVVAAYKALPSLEKALHNLVHGTAHLADYETIGLDALSAAAVIDPALAPEITVISTLAPFLIQGYLVGDIGGDKDPIHDAQTSRNFQPGDPAARL
jgi:hypothetical protein